MASGGRAQELNSFPAASASSNGVFVWMDGSWRSVRLADYGLGLQGIGAGDVDAGAVHKFTDRIDGTAASGGIGFALPPGTLPSAFGANARVAFYGGYLRVDAGQSATSTSGDNVGVLLGGGLFLECGACVITSRLNTKHEAWQAGAIVTGDIRFGSVTISPSVELLGGAASVRQNLYQQRDSGTITTYVANTWLQWSDAGAKIGLGVSMPVAPALVLGIGAKVGAVVRQVSFKGNDAFFFSALPVGAGSSIARSESTGAALVGLQGQVTWQPTPLVRVRLFGGLDYDTHVPGIVAPTFTPAQLNSIAFIGSPASIGYFDLMSFYAGLGITVAFGP